MMPSMRSLTKGPVLPRKTAYVPFSTVLEELRDEPFHKWALRLIGIHLGRLSLGRHMTNEPFLTRRYAVVPPITRPRRFLEIPFSAIGGHPHHG